MRHAPVPTRALALAVGACAIAAACTGVVGDAPGSAAPPLDATPPAATLKRLTRAQYANALHDLLGASVVVPTAIEPDVVAAGLLSVGASVGSISRRGVEQFEDAAFRVAAQALAAGPARDALVGCAPQGVRDDACARAFVVRFGRRAWRRPLADDEVDRWTSVAGSSATALGDFHLGLGFALAGLLESPAFLFRSETGEPDPTHAGRRRYTPYEMASRLSFFLWNTTPDDALLDAAARGELTDDATLGAAVDRLLASPRARTAVRTFFSELLALQGLDDLSKDAKVFPAASPDLGPSAREATLRNLEEQLLVRGADYREIFTTRRTFVDRKLASLYGVPAPSLEGFGEVELPEGSPRVGLLGEASFLALYAHPTSSSATVRGKLVRGALLCDTIGSPPANVNTSLPDPKDSGPTLRDRIKVHLEQPFCAACHTSMDPIGLGLETFDGIGAYRTTENGATIDATGSLDGTPFHDLPTLAKAVAGHPHLPGCVTREVYRFAAGAPEPRDATPEIESLTRAFVADGWSFVGLLRKVALSAGFRTATENR